MLRDQFVGNPLGRGDLADAAIETRSKIPPCHTAKGFEGLRLREWVKKMIAW